MINPLAYLAPWWLALRYGLGWPHRNRKLEAERRRLGPKVSIITTCQRLSPGSFAWFSAETLAEAYGSTAMAELALIVSLNPYADFEVVTGSDDSMTVTRRRPRSDGDTGLPPAA